MEHTLIDVLIDSVGPSMHGAMHKRQHFEINSLRYVEPVEVAERCRHASMVPTVYTKDDTRCCSLYHLKSV